MKGVLARRPQDGVTPKTTVVQPLECLSLEQCRCPVRGSLDICESDLLFARFLRPSRQTLGWELYEIMLLPNTGP